MRSIISLIATLTAGGIILFNFNSEFRFFIEKFINIEALCFNCTVNVGGGILVDKSGFAQSGNAIDIKSTLKNVKNLKRSEIDYLAKPIKILTQKTEIFLNGSFSLKLNNVNFYETPPFAEITMNEISPHAFKVQSGWIQYLISDYGRAKLIVREISISSITVSVILE